MGERTMSVGTNSYDRAMDLLNHILQVMAERNSFCSSYGGCSGDYELRRLEITLYPLAGRTLGQWASSLFRPNKPVSIARLARWDEYSKGYVDDDGYANERHYRAVIQLTLSREPRPLACAPGVWNDTNALGWTGVFEAGTIQWRTLAKLQSTLFSREPMPVPEMSLSLLNAFPNLLLIVFLSEVSGQDPDQYAAEQV
jgi:hypothetical protein